MRPAGTRVAAAGAALLALAACGDHPNLGGTTETENMLASRELRVDSLLSGWNRLDTVATVAVLRLDTGNFDFARATDSGRDVSVERIDGPRLPFRIVYWDRNLGRARLEVRLEPWLQEPGSRILLRWGLRDSVRADSAGVWKAVPEARREALTSVLVDDFEHAGLQTKLPNPGSWYSFASDTATKVSTPEIVAADGGRAGKALHISYAGPNPAADFVYTGVSLSEPRVFRSLDSIVFWAKGPGTLTFAFDKLVGNAGKAVRGAVELDSNWTRYRVRPQDLEPANGIGGNVGWEPVRDSVSNLTFFVSHGTDLWLDDIRLHGLTLDDFP